MPSTRKVDPATALKTTGGIASLKDNKDFQSMMNKMGKGDSKALKPTKGK